MASEKNARMPHSRDGGESDPRILRAGRSNASGACLGQWRPVVGSKRSTKQLPTNGVGGWSEKHPADPTVDKVDKQHANVGLEAYAVSK
ncbi:hypothetical protein MGG_16833 [Pyricularia oryzae 70-15]|uniref:Uncharacterized protein n=1 Tax=Pyricularia oryzae (strain 70-15 / ATCC MYA-4617 / FGSC 8958) TaxID=242507 RepID=G4N377_PYRO7|nr:uncharacterized protein MGG_16833 [Pyricularia oryzae 70-15]EHA52633.1 hypothetical protein MGG_16833 [Pyricularia oryzae 70-15]